MDQFVKEHREQREARLSKYDAIPDPNDLRAARTKPSLDKVHAHYVSAALRIANQQIYENNVWHRPMLSKFPLRNVTCVALRFPDHGFVKKLETDNDCGSENTLFKIGTGAGKNQELVL